ncbi:hypothetical protein HK405_013189, partial [Cladochytrium tenue]
MAVFAFVTAGLLVLAKAFLTVATTGAAAADSTSTDCTVVSDALPQLASLNVSCCAGVVGGA